MAEARTARAFWIQEPGRGAIVSSDLPPRQDDQVLVRTLYSAISRGTEALVFRGEVPDSQRRAMRAPFQEGEFPAPVKYGYTSVGRVVEGPDTEAESLRGRAVFCLHPHQDRFVVPADAVTPLPEGLPAGRAVLAPSMETAVNAVWDARPTVGDRVVVVGAGVVGLLAAWLCRQVPATRVTVVDVEPGRETVARKLGLVFRTDVGTEDADLVVHASGSPEGLVSALSAAGPEGTVVELSWHGTAPVPLPLGEAFHSRRLTLRSSQVSRLPPERTPRWDRGRRMELALELLLDPVLDALITHESDFEELPRVLEELSHGPGETLCHRIRYQERRQTDRKGDGSR